MRVALFVSLGWRSALVASVLSACSAAAAIAPDAAPASSPPPATTLPLQSEAPSATAAPTQELVASSDEPQFEPVMILEKGSPGEWDSRWVAEPYVVQHDGRWYLFYNGSDLNRRGVGLAISEDGRSWAKYGDGPIYLHRGLEPTAWGTPRFEGDRWVMYYTVGPAGKFREIYRASAPAPEGPWQHDPDFVLPSPRTSWNQRFMPTGLIELEGSLALSYIGFDNTHTVLSPGLFLSSDGGAWEPLEEPLLAAGQPGEWNANGHIPSNIVRTDSGYELFFIGIDRDWREGPSESLDTLRIGRMTSTDGLQWTVDDAEWQMIDSGETIWYGMNVVVVDGEHWLFLAHDKFDGIVQLRGRLDG